MGRLESSDRRFSVSLGSRGSVLVIVLITLIFTAFALVAFIEKASGDLLVEARVVEATRLRAEAYSALETTLAVLEDFRQVSGGLHSPAEGWNDPLTFAAWTPAEGRTVEVTFEDESGKLSLPRADSTALNNLFKAWQIPDADAERLADALLGWMKRDHVYTTAISPDYDRGQIPYEPPARSLRSFEELAAIDVARELLYGEDGRPNALWYRFTNSVSLFNFRQTNVNGAKPDVLTGIGQFDETQQQKVSEYLNGDGAYKIQGPAWFTDLGSVRAIAGLAGNPSGFGTTISALRVSLTVHDGQSVFRLSAVVAPTQNGATTVQTNASASRTATSTTPNQTTATPSQPSGAPAASTNPNAAVNAKKLNYPFTLLEIRENDEIPTSPPPTSCRFPLTMCAKPFNFLRGGPPPPKVALLPDAVFFTRTIPVTPGATGTAVATQVELALEALSPFPVTQLYHGYYWKLGLEKAFVFATYRRRFTSEQIATWKGAELVLPTFATLFGAEVAPATTVVLTTAEGLTAVHWENGSMPARVLCQSVPAEVSDEERSRLREELLRAIGGSKTVIDLPAAPAAQSSRDDDELVFLSGAVESRLSRGTTAALDVRDKIQLAALRRARTRDIWMWRVALGSAALVLLLFLGEIALWGGNNIWQKARIAKMNAQQPSVNKIMSAQNLATRIEDLSTKRLLPLEMVSLVAGKISGSIVFQRAVTDVKDRDRILIEAKTDNSADIILFKTALEALPECEHVEFSNQRNTPGSSTSTFSLSVTFKPGAVKPDPT